MESRPHARPHLSVLLPLNGLFVTMVIGFTLLPLGCGKDSDSSSGPPLEDAVGTTFYPMTFMTERIAGDSVSVHCPIPEGVDPIFWRPDRADLAFYQRVKLVVTNGAEFEKWVATAPLPASRVVKSAQGFASRFLTFEGGVSHSHGAGGQHTHVGIDGHTWLDPLNALEQAAAIRDALTRTWPDREAAFRAGFQTLEVELNSLHQRFSELMPASKGVLFLTNHPAYGYLAVRYGWHLESLDIDPDSEIESATFEKIARFTTEFPRALLLFESPPSDAVVRQLEATSVRSVVFSPLESLPAEDQRAGRDYVSAMHQNLDRLKEALTR